MVLRYEWPLSIRWLVGSKVSEVILLTGGELVDPSGHRRAEILIADGHVRELLEPGKEPETTIHNVLRIDASGCIVTPGLVDMHTHLREPGGERAETIESGCRAAAAGGYGAVCAMPNTNPAADSSAVVTFVRERARAAGVCEVVPAGAISLGLEGISLSPMAELARAGVVLFSDDGRCVQSAELMRRALEYATQLGCIVSNHAEDEALVCRGGNSAGEREGVMNEGAESARLGLPGRPWAAEAAIVARDLLLAEMTGGRLHVPHVSTGSAVEAIAAAKHKGVAVTAEVTPHHLVLTEDACAEYDPVYRVNPPLRTRKDIESVRAALKDGVIDVIATDHAPHADEEKERPFEEAPPGMVGLETALSVVLTELVYPGHLSLERALEAMSWTPAKILGLENHGGVIAVGRTANLIVVDLNARWTVDPARLKTTGNNSPFAGKQLRGRVKHTIYRGRLIHSDDVDQVDLA